MMRLYFEIKYNTKRRSAGVYVSPNIDWDDENYIALSILPEGIWALATKAERVWKEWSNGKVEWFKHREDPHQPVDLKEFLFVKLKAKPL